MPRKYSPSGDKLSEHITEADALVADADLELALIAQLLKETRYDSIGVKIDEHLRKLQQARAHLRAAEAIRKEESPRRQAALSREASKRRK